MLKQKLDDLVTEATATFEAADSRKVLYDAKVKYLGRQGLFQELTRELGKLPASDKPAAGQWLNQARQQLESTYALCEGRLEEKELSQKLATERLDLTLPAPESPRGGLHPITQVAHEIASILERMGYSIRLGPLVEFDRYNFEALNIPANHPARDMQDTFYISGHPERVLRTHTSPIQIRVMENESPPLRIVGMGGTFRRDDDVSHLPHFHQIEGLAIDREVSMAHLKGTISYFVREFFGADLKTRFRPSFFPFTEPSAEVDCQCPLCSGDGSSCRMCKQTGWVEIGGSGLVHPNVLQSAGLDPKQYQGFAFGFGIERMAIIKYGVEDIRLFIEGDTRFLGQFRGASGVHA